MSTKVLWLTFSLFVSILSIHSLSGAQEQFSSLDKSGNQSTFTPRQSKSLKYTKKTSSNEISQNLCAQGYKSYIGMDKKNICQNNPATPDNIYSCVLIESKTSAQNIDRPEPCNLNFAQNTGSLVVTQKNTSYRPFAYGQEARSYDPSPAKSIEAQCCLRDSNISITSNP